MTLQPNSSSNGRISPVLIRSLGCLGSATLLGSSIILNGLALAQETLDSALFEDAPPIAAVEPEPVYVAPEPAYVEPEPVYIPPEPAYVAPEPVYIPPEPAYVEPEPVYVPPEPAYVEPEPVYIAPEPAYVEPEPVYVAPEPAYVEPEPVYEAPLPAPALESPVVNLTPQDLAPVESAQEYVDETQVETVFNDPLQDYVPPLEVAPEATAGGNSLVDSSDLYSTGATSDEVIYAEDAELLGNPEVIVSEPAGSVDATGESIPNAVPAAAPGEAIAGEPEALEVPLAEIPVGSEVAAGSASPAAPTNVTAAQAAKVQTAVSPSPSYHGHGASGAHLPAPSTAATTTLAGHASHNSGYSVTYPSAGNPLSVAVHSLGQNFSSSLNVGSYFARTLRPNAVPGNGDRQLLFPLSMPAPISSVFGWRTHPIFGNRRFHSGTDLAAEQGTPIVATLSGRASTADFVGGYGLTVVLDHADGKHQTLYGHMSEIYVQPGQVVQQGEVIGRVGSTGNSTGPHLHFEVRELTNDGWVAIDPGRFLEGSIAQLMQLLRTQPSEQLMQPMQPISIAQIPLKLSLGSFGQQQQSVTLQPQQNQQPIKLSTGLQPLLQRQFLQQPTQSFKPTTPLEQKVVEVVKALEGNPTASVQTNAGTTQFNPESWSYQQPKLVSQAMNKNNGHNH